MWWVHPAGVTNACFVTYEYLIALIYCANDTPLNFCLPFPLWRNLTSWSEFRTEDVYLHWDWNQAWRWGSVSRVQGEFVVSEFELLSEQLLRVFFVWYSRSVVCIPAGASKVELCKDEEGNIFFQNWESCCINSLVLQCLWKSFRNAENILFLVIKDESVHCKMCFRNKNWRRNKK